LEVPLDICSALPATGISASDRVGVVAEGLGRDEADLFALADDLRALGADPGRHDLAWRYGVDAEILDPVRRTNELGQWLHWGIARR
jgi:GMP synthase (glutamine-hydrolysing)